MPGTWDFTHRHDNKFNTRTLLPLAPQQLMSWMRWGVQRFWTSVSIPEVSSSTWELGSTVCACPLAGDTMPTAVLVLLNCLWFWGSSLCAFQVHLQRVGAASAGAGLGFGLPSVWPSSRSARQLLLSWGRVRFLHTITDLWKLRAERETAVKCTNIFQTRSGLAEGQNSRGFLMCYIFFWFNKRKNPQEQDGIYSLRIKGGISHPYNSEIKTCLTGQ